MTGDTLAKRRTTTKDIGLLRQLYVDKQLNLAPEFQRNSVWPRAAKAYLIDTILHDLPIPPLFFRRTNSAQSGRPSYEVIDGQQRLRAVFLFMDNRLRLTESKNESWARERWSDLSPDDKQRILDYDFVVEELSGYTPAEIKDIFARANRYTVTLSSQELRHAQEEGAFAEFVEVVGKWSFWLENKIFTPSQFGRMRNIEFAAEMAILLAEGPQDKKSSVDVWYANYRENFPLADEIRNRLIALNDWVLEALPDLSKSRFRKPVDYYAVIGALDLASVQADKLGELDPKASGERFLSFEKELQKVAKEMSDPLTSGKARVDRDAARYYLAASRQTDNIIPRQTRIDILTSMIS